MRKIVTRGLNPMTGDWIILSLQDIKETEENPTTEEDINAYLAELSKLIQTHTCVAAEAGSVMFLQNGQKYVTFDPRKFLAVEVYVEKYFTVETIKR